MPRQQKNGMADAMLFFSPTRTASLGSREYVYPSLCIASALLPGKRSNA